MTFVVDCACSFYFEEVSSVSFAAVSWSFDTSFCLFFYLTWVFKVFTEQVALFSCGIQTNKRSVPNSLMVNRVVTGSHLTSQPPLPALWMGRIASTPSLLRRSAMLFLRMAGLWHDRGESMDH